MKNLENLPDALFDLLARKKYESLNAAEKRLVDEHISEVEFDQFSKIVQDFQSLDTTMPIEAPGLPAHKEVSAIKRVLTYKIPLYQVAVIALVLIVSTLAMSRSHSAEGPPAHHPYAIPTTQSSSEAAIPRISEEAIEERIEEIKHVVELDKAEEGKSLAEDDYPEALVFNL